MVKIKRLPAAHGTIPDIVDIVHNTGPANIQWKVSPSLTELIGKNTLDF